MPSQDSTRWWYAAEAAVGGAIVSLPLSIGGSPPWTLVLLWVLSSVALVTWLIGAWRHRRRAGVHLSLALPVGLVVMAVLSLVPLPAGLLALVSPVNAELRDFALVPLGLDAARPLTMDAPSTWRALARLLSLGALGFVALQLGRLQGARLRLLLTVAITGAFVAVVGFGHLIAGADALFGMLRYYGNVPFVSFFGNVNHLAGFLAFCGTVALGLALDTRNKEAAVGLYALALLCGTGVFLSFSRGGIATFVVTWALVGALQLARRQGGVRAALPWLVIGGTVLFALSLASEQILDRLATVSSVDKLAKTKIELWPMLWDGALAFWRGGMGLGAFELGFTRFQTTQLDVTFTHPENLVLQWLAELGVPLTLVLFGASAVVAVQLVHQARGRVLEPVLLLGVLGVGFHDVFDFALELNALPVAVVVVLGLVASTGDAEGLPKRSVHRGWLVAGSAVVLLALVGLVKGLPTHADAEAKVVQLVKAGAPSAEVRQAALTAIDRHPSDWVLYSAVANQLSVEGAARESLAWVNRLLFLRPDDPRAHVAAGRALLRLGQPTQALLEFKVAWRLGDSTSLDEGLLLAARLGQYDRLLVEEAGLLQRLWERYQALGKRAEAKALLEAVLVLPPSEAVRVEALTLAVQQAEVEQQPNVALERLEALPADSRSTTPMVLLKARVLGQVGRLDEASSLLDGLSRKSPQDVGVAMALAAVLSQQQRTTEARAVLERTRPFVSGPQGRSQLFQREAELWAQDERWPRALEALQTASRIEPTRADLKYRLAQVYERMGSLHSALDEVRRGRLLDTPEGAKAQDSWVARLEAALASRIE
ncbi:MAG: O-antigen ligase family protein [Myxococcaceae bacterium]|jgi:tetratricopeptide (TPR) repeat protein|nr:O-antigen ligase family protein [Myxococcaceae bacterium]